MYAYDRGQESKFPKFRTFPQILIVLIEAKDCWDDLFCIKSDFFTNFWYFYDLPWDSDPLEG